MYGHSVFTNRRRRKVQGTSDRIMTPHLTVPGCPVPRCESSQWRASRARHALSQTICHRICLARLDQRFPQAPPLIHGWWRLHIRAAIIPLKVWQTTCYLLRFSPCSHHPRTRIRSSRINRAALTVPAIVEQSNCRPNHPYRTRSVPYWQNAPRILSD